MTTTKPTLAIGLLLAGLAGTAQAHQRRTHAPRAVAIHQRTLEVTGTRHADKIVLRAGPGRTLRVLIGRHGFRVQDSRFDRVRVATGSGNDVVTVDASRGEVPRNESIDGGKGNDSVSFEGSSADENIALSADGSRARLARDLGHMRIELSHVERVGVAARGGADAFTVGDLTGTGVHDVTSDVAGAIGGAGSTAESDRTTVDGTANADEIHVGGANGTATVTGLPATVTVTHASSPADELIVNGQAGDDTIDASSLGAGAPALSIEGGDGNDTLTGSAGDDVVDGGPGNDTVSMGAGDDQFVWNPGDGSDTVDGQDGNDQLVFNGSDANENFAVSANGTRVRLTRDVDAVTMDLNGLENVDVASLGGNDTLTVDDLAGTDVTTVTHDLASTIGGRTPDAGTDQTIVNGTASADTIVVSGAAGAGHVNGLSATVDVTHADPSMDGLTVNGLGGDDTITAAPATTTAPHVTIDGGDGNDTLTGDRGGDTLDGGAGTDTLTGGPGADTISGGPGNDTASMGAGDDQFVWNPGDGSDIVEGQDGSDSLVFNGSNANENFDLSANGTRARLSRDVGAVTMDLNGLEHVDVASLGGNDTLTVNDLTGTGVQTVTHDLASASGGTTPDTGTDHTIVNGTANADSVAISGSAGTAQVTGLAAAVDVVHADPSVDQLTINGLAGADTISASSLASDSVQLILNGGDDNDVLTGSAGNDLVNGGRGTDTALMGAGDDTFVWNPGDGNDVVEGQAGNDRLQFNGANVSENIDISANGSRVRLSRDIANITMDLNGLEEIDLAVLGGADNVTVNDLSGTGMTKVAADLGAIGGGDDGAADQVIVNGTSAADTIRATAAGAGSVQVTGLAAEIDIAHANPTQDQLSVNGLAGDDQINGSGLTTQSILFRADGGDGNDFIVGGDGNDVLLGGNGDDVIFGGPGIDTIDGGPGNNTINQD
jgi:Ca2+-binding RTX toxin-like protein